MFLGGFYSCSFLGLILTFVLPVLIIIYGSLSIQECPLNIFIPIYLIVSGEILVYVSLIDSSIQSHDSIFNRHS